MRFYRFLDAKKEGKIDDIEYKRYYTSDIEKELAKKYLRNLRLNIYYGIL